MIKACRFISAADRAADPTAPTGLADLPHPPSPLLHVAPRWPKQGDLDSSLNNAVRGFLGKPCEIDGMPLRALPWIFSMCVVNDQVLQCDSSRCLAKPADVAKLRIAVEDYLSDHSVDTECVFDSLLVVNELASNAMYEHGKPIRVQVQCSDSDKHVWIDVFDTAPTPPAGDDEGSWALGLVARLSVAWGVVPAPDGKTVWASLRHA